MDGPTQAATPPLGTASASEPGTPRTPEPGTPPTREPVQRWRLTFARDAVASELAGRAAMDAWQATLAASGLPLAGLEPGGPERARFALGAPLPASASGRAELADIWLVERRPVWAVREGLEGRMPPAHRYVGAEDVWLGMPPLPGQIVAAAWTVTLAAPEPERSALEAATQALLDATTLPRVRARAGGDRPYDLRPLLEDVAVTPAPPDRASAGALRITTRVDPALGSGRPEEVVAALGDLLGAPLAIASIVREGLILADLRREPSPSRAARPSRNRRG